MLTIIVAHDENLLIGKKGGLPWHISEDLKHFKRNTLGKPVLMGRKVFEEVGEKPLPNRRNIVLTRRKYDQVETAASIEEALKMAEGAAEIMIAGGGEIYRQMLDHADRMLVTLVNGVYEGDTYFPEYRHNIGKEWAEVKREQRQGFSFITYQRIKKLESQPVSGDNNKV